MICNTNFIKKVVIKTKRLGVSFDTTFKSTNITSISKEYKQFIDGALSGRYFITITGWIGKDDDIDTLFNEDINLTSSYIYDNWDVTITMNNGELIHVVGCPKITTSINSSKGEQVFNFELKGYIK